MEKFILVQLLVNTGMKEDKREYFQKEKEKQKSYVVNGFRYLLTPIFNSTFKMQFRLIILEISFLGKYRASFSSIRAWADL